MTASRRLYKTSGQRVGFAIGRYIYNCDGVGIGQLRGSHVYTIDGEYVGELVDQMVVEHNRTYANTVARSPRDRHVPYCRDRGPRIGYRDLSYLLLPASNS
jgi:sporulation protein YlmC with PRC-barrel domain